MLRKILFSTTPTNVMAALGLLILRIGLGLTMLLSHGLPKALAFNESSGQFPDPLGFGSVTSMLLAIFAEVVCSLLLTVGLATRLAAIPLLVTMAVAFFMIHAMDPLKIKELSLIYGLGYLTLFFAGPGWISLDAMLSRK